MTQSSKELKRKRIIVNMINLLFMSQTHEEMHLIRYYRMLPKTEDILNIMERVHQVPKKHLNYWVAADYIQDTLYWF